VLPAALLALAVAQDADVYSLKIGTPGEVRAEIGKIVRTADGAVATPADIAKAADGMRWVFLGENHATAPHQQLHADVVKALLDRGRKVVVGLEMLTRPVQPVLDEWVAGKLEEAEFLEKVDWKNQWGFEYSFYRPVFDTCRWNRIPMVALNVPRDWVRAVGRGGYDALTPEQKAELPSEFPLDNAAHRSIFAALMGGHPPAGDRGENIYRAQILWDVGMADTALRHREKTGQKDAVYVVMAGSGHIMYGQGINFHVQRRTKEPGVTVTMGTAAEARNVSKGLGDFVYLTAPVKP
jgi:uncharacterized iron-regulated protein